MSSASNRLTGFRLVLTLFLYLIPCAWLAVLYIAVNQAPHPDAFRTEANYLSADFLGLSA